MDGGFTSYGARYRSEGRFRGVGRALRAKGRCEFASKDPRLQVATACRRPQWFKLKPSATTPDGGCSAVRRDGDEAHVRLDGYAAVRWHGSATGGASVGTRRLACAMARLRCGFDPASGVQPLCLDPLRVCRAPRDRQVGTIYAGQMNYVQSRPQGLK